MTFLDRFSRDFRYGLRGLIARPGFFATVALTLALGLGVNAAIFSLFHGTLMKPLPVAEPQRLVNLEAPGPRSGWNSSNNSGTTRSTFSYPMFKDLEAAQNGVIQLAGHRGDSMNLTWQGNTSHIEASVVTGNYFSALGLAPALGRLLGPQDDAVTGQAESVVLSHGLWQDRFGGAADVVGQSVRVNGLPLTIVGVAPAGFTGTTLGTRTQLFVPASVRWPERIDGLPEHERRDYFWLYVFGRLAPGVSAEMAREKLQVRYHAVVNDIEAPTLQGMSDNGMAEFRAKQLVLTPGARGQSRVPENATTPLTTLMVVSALVLLIACLNIANLQLARGAVRANEMAVRSAIGASAGQLRRQLLVESLLLALAGAVLALPVAWLVGKGLSLYDATEMANVGSAGHLSFTTVAFTLVVALFTTVLFGLFPAWRLSRTTPADALRARSGQPGSDRSAGAFRSGLAITQIAFSLALLVLAGLFARSLENIARTDLGMQVERVLTFTVAPALSGYNTERSRQLFAEAERALSALPGVTGVAMSSVGVLLGHDWGTSVSVQGYQAAPDESTNSSRNDVSPGFFRTLGIPVLAGREFTDQDIAGAPRVAMVNRRFVERYELGSDVVGKRLSLSAGNPELDIEIVGLVADSAYSNVKDEVPPVLFLPLAQDENASHANVYVRSTQDAAALGQSVTQAMNRLDAELPLLQLRTLDEQVRQNTARDRIVGLLSAGFALLATLLAAVGLYGLMAYAVSQRTREMGLRLALGSSPARVRGMVLRQIARLAVVGIVIGLVLAVALGTAARSLLYGLAGHDPLVLLAATVLLALVVFAAAWWPAWRASRTDPMVALRDE